MLGGVSRQVVGGCVGRLVGRGRGTRYLLTRAPSPGSSLDNTLLAAEWLWQGFPNQLCSLEHPASYGT